MRIRTWGRNIKSNTNWCNKYKLVLRIPGTVDLGGKSNYARHFDMMSLSGLGILDTFGREIFSIYEYFTILAGCNKVRTFSNCVNMRVKRVQFWKFGKLPSYTDHHCMARVVGGWALAPDWVKIYQCQGKMWGKTQKQCWCRAGAACADNNSLLAVFMMNHRCSMIARLVRAVNRNDRKNCSSIV